ncbi:MAG TPA: YhjD/YihY/BrkB family envelope integrity protein, partial [Verrucomicrobiae bacterium]|nr:YhjD/YihY/BrkB family envelope integrity protein [Verrucomicrobiae bacterium]
LMVLGTGLMLSISILLSAILATPIRFFLRFVPHSGAATATMSAVSSIVIMTVLFALIYKVVPDIYIRWSDVWIGALVTSLLFNAGKWVIGFYLSTAGVGSPYAAAGSLIVFLTWVYYSVQIFLLGAEFTHEYALRRGSYSRAARRARPFWRSRPHGTA